MKVRAFHVGVSVIGSMVLILLASAIVGAQGELDQAGDWPHFGYDGTYSGYNPHEAALTITNVTTLRRKWGIGCNDGYFSVIFRSPAVFDGVLYTSGAGDNLRAYNARMGLRLWDFGAGNLGWAPQPVVASDGTVFYMEETYPTYLYAVNGKTGNQLWKSPIGFELGYRGAAEALITVDEARDLLYVLEDSVPDEGQLYAIDKQTGAVAWMMSEPTHRTDFVGNYALLRDGLLYAAADITTTTYPFHAHHALQILPDSQTVARAYDRPKPDNYYRIDQVAFCDDRLIVGYDYQYDPVKLIAAYDPISSTIAWREDFASAITGKVACNPELGRLYVPTDPYLYALDLSDGSEVWRYRGYDEIHSPSVANGVVYVLSDNNMYALDEATGNRVLSYPLGHSADETTQVAIAGGMLYFSGNGGTCDLYALALPGPDTVFLPLAVRSPACTPH